MINIDPFKGEDAYSWTRASALHSGPFYRTRTRSVFEKVQGTITDTTGAAIPNAIITLTNVDNDVTRTVKTSGSRGYRFNSLAPGKYKVHVDAPGIASREITSDVNVALSVQNSQTTVEVSADRASSSRSDHVRECRATNRVRVARWK